jgi:hypothetical protein
MKSHEESLIAALEAWGKDVTELRKHIAELQAQDERNLAEMADMGRELDHLRSWKAEATVVLTEWEAVWEHLGRPGELGESKSRAVRAELDRERAKVAAALKVHFPGGGPVESPLTFCDGCGEEWPCPSARDLGVEEA